jgi:hypothetical protein
MLTMQRIREILAECDLAGSQLDDAAAYFYSVQLELTEQDVRDIATRLVKGVDHGSKES